VRSRVHALDVRLRELALDDLALAERVGELALEGLAELVILEGKELPACFLTPDYNYKSKIKR